MDLLWVAGLVLLGVIAFGPVLWGGMSFYFRDTLIFYVPHAHIVGEAWNEGHVPLWVPEIGAGYPFAADPHAMAFYPLTLLLALLPQPWSLNVSTVLHVILCGAGVSLLLRRWAFSAPSAAVAGASLMFCGYTASLASLTNILRGLAWTPFCLLAHDHFLERRSFRALALTALILAVEGMATDPQHLVFTGLLMALLPWMRPAPAQRPVPVERRPGVFGGPAGSLAGLATACALAGLMLAVQYIPLAELFTQSARSTGVSQAELAHYQVDPRFLLNLLLPVPFPDPADPRHPFSFPDRRVPLLQDIHVGWPLLSVALLGLFGWKRWPDGEEAPPPLRAPALTAAVLAMLGLGMGLGDSFYLFPAASRLVPPVRLFRYPAKYFFFTALALAILIGCGLESLRGEGRRPAALFTVLLLSGAILLSAASLGLSSDGATLAEEYLGVASMDPAAGMLEDQWVLELVEAAGTCLVLGLLLHGALRQGHRPEHIGLVVVSLALFTTALNTLPSIPRIQEPFVSRSPRTAQLLKQIGGPRPAPRFVFHPPPAGAHTDALMPTALSRLRLGGELMTQLRGVPHGCNGLLGSPALALSGTRELQTLIRTQGPGGGDRLAAAAGASFRLSTVLTPQGDPADRIIGRTGILDIWELAGASPRAFIPARAIPAVPGRDLPDPEALRGMPQQAVFDPGGTDRGPLTPLGVTNCRLTRYEPTRVDVDVQLEGEGLLVLLDQAYPGWVARVDGHRRPILKVAGVFRGVPVREGEHKVVMTYEPLSYRAGAAVSMVGLVVTMGLIAFGNRGQSLLSGGAGWERSRSE